MLKDFLKEYKSLPAIKQDIYSGIRNHSNYYPRFWFIDSKYILKNINGDIEKIDFYWKALMFSFLSKSVYRYSPENYHYCIDYLSLQYDNDFRFIFKNKLQLFVDVEFSKIDKMSNLNTVEYSLARIDSYASWIVKVIAYLNKQCCITNLTSRLLLGKNDYYLMEEFSTEEHSLSFQFLNSYFKALSNDR